MSESEVTAPMVTPIPTSTMPFDQAGVLLRAAREAQGLHIAALAVALKVPVKKLEALEAGRYNELPDMVFVRSLAMSVCRTLKISPAAVLAALPSVPTHGIHSVGSGLNTAFKEADASSATSLRAQISSPLGLGAGALLLATVVIFFWQNKSAPEGITLVPEAAQPQPRASISETPVVSPPTLQVAPVATTEVAATSAGVPASPDILEITAHGVSWVEVLDADAAPLLRKLTADGEILRIEGKLPLSVTAGRADQIAVRVRGQMLDLAPLARDNVARFEVK